MTTPASAPKKTPAASRTATAATSVSTRKGVSRSLDITLTIVFLVLDALMVAALFVPALFLSMSVAGCAASVEVPCNYGVVSAGFYIALFGPSVAFIVNLVLSIVFLVQKRTAWLLSLLVGVGGLLVFILGVALVFVPFG